MKAGRSWLLYRCLDQLPPVLLDPSEDKRSLLMGYFAAGETVEQGMLCASCDGKKYLVRNYGRVTEKIIVRDVVPIGLWVIIAVTNMFFPSQN